ncbi:MAG: formylglycine-generating enzyme family protein [Bacteroidales bacterium]|nr:formylglycine-generating enzyme family protein [Bacteroidales bacterium]
MKQIILFFFLLLGFAAGAQNVTVKKPKKAQQTTTQAAPKRLQKEAPKKNVASNAQSKPAKKVEAKRVVRTFYANGVSFEMVEVRGGTFRMGATSEQGSDAGSDEKPVHSVTLSSYYIGKTEVTQALWKAVMGDNPSYFKGDNLPVEDVSWNDCQVFVRKLNSLTGQRFRLPTEAEWEYACRGGNNSRGYKYSGSNYIEDVAWYGDNSGSETHPVASKSPNELGLYDMSGNVWEWCSDWYGSYTSVSQTNPQGPYDGSSRVFRGGSGSCYARGCRSSLRLSRDPACRLNSLGLRLAL